MNPRKTPAGAGTAGQPKLYQFKLVLLGEQAVGKSSLVLRFVKDQFSDYRESTVRPINMVARRTLTCV